LISNNKLATFEDPPLQYKQLISLDLQNNTLIELSWVPPQLGTLLPANVPLEIVQLFARISVQFLCLKYTKFREVSSLLGASATFLRIISSTLTRVMASSLPGSLKTVELLTQ
jgi:hypothetical protein